MAKNADQLRTALQEIARIAGSVTTSNGSSAGSVAEDPEAGGCRIMQLPARLQERAAHEAARINPVNAPLHEIAVTGVIDPAFLTLLTAKYWGPQARRLTVSYMEATPADLRARIVSHMNAWNATAGISFVETAGVGDVRISRGPGGYWSYLGTDIRLIPKTRQTMNLQGFTMSTSEAEYHRVVRHETGHTMGFPHEHMRRALVARIDPQKAYDYFWRTQGWDKKMVDAQVLTPLDSASIVGTPADEDSIMCYQLPGSITKDGKPIRGGTDINRTDYAFAAKIYPKTVAAGDTEDTDGDGASLALAALDWDPADDVPVPV